MRKKLCTIMHIGKLIIAVAFICPMSTIQSAEGIDTSSRITNLFVHAIAKDNDKTLFSAITYNEQLPKGCLYLMKDMYSYISKRLHRVTPNNQDSINTGIILRFSDNIINYPYRTAYHCYDEQNQRIPPLCLVKRISCFQHSFLQCMVGQAFVVPLVKRYTQLSRTLSVASGLIACLALGKIVSSPRVAIAADDDNAIPTVIDKTYTVAQRLQTIFILGSYYTIINNNCKVIEQTHYEINSKDIGKIIPKLYSDGRVALKTTGSRTSEGNGILIPTATVGQLRVQPWLPIPPTTPQRERTSCKPE